MYNCFGIDKNKRNGGEKTMRSMYKKIFYLFFLVICLTFVVFRNLT
ncbi:hypothetical protein B4110_2033 [Parageobacillus toebii]|uniref:Uncharacterized protein n=1 Tax=Parageobacillus toebii TaxID=153151 RepID=A0A150N6S2_9BACL|nr:hypothetical protein B4110_2033 [Parageobacillus toebii]